MVRVEKIRYYKYVTLYTNSEDSRMYLAWNGRE